MIIHASFVEAWYKNSIYVKIHDVPDTLSGRILRLETNVPPLDSHSEIYGDRISTIDFKEVPSLEEEEEIIDKSIGEVVHQLPVIAFDATLHFAKECRAVEEVKNLLKVRGGPHIVNLLGRTDDEKLVFPRYLEQVLSVFFKASISEYRQLLIELADAVIFLHSQGIIHRDLAPRNILATSDRQHLLLCDLESKYGSNYCPEIALARDRNLPESEIPYSEKSDVFCFGTTVADFILANTVRTPWQYTGNFVPPAPFDKILQACIRQDPADRPSMREVRKLLEAVEVPGMFVAFEQDAS